MCANVLICRKTVQLEVAKKEIVNCDKKGKPDKQQPATVDEASKSQRYFFMAQIKRFTSRQFLAT